MRVTVELDDKYDDERVLNLVVNNLAAHYKHELEERIRDHLTAAVNVEFRKVIAERTRQLLEQSTITVEDKTFSLNEYLAHLLGRTKAPPGARISFYEMNKTYVGAVMDKVLAHSTEEHLHAVLKPFAAELKEKLRTRLSEMLLTDIVRS